MALLKDGTIVLNEWTEGIGSSETSNISDMRNIDNYSDPGLAQINFKTAAATGSISDLPLAFDRAKPNSGVNGDFAITEDGKLWVDSSSVGSGWAHLTGDTSGAFLGMAIWEGFVVCLGTTGVWLYNLTAGTPDWINPGAGVGAVWKNDLDPSARPRPTLLSDDGNLYFGNGTKVGYLEKIGATFDPNNAATYNWVVDGLDLPADYIIKSLAELNGQLYVGTIVPLGGTNVNAKIADIFPWDKNSPSYDEPIHLNEYGVHQMIVDDNTLYIVAGKEGIIYQSNGVVANELTRLPKRITGVAQNRWLDFYPNAIASNKGRIFFGVSASTPSASLGGIGVWSFTREGNLNFENELSTGLTDGTAGVIGALMIADAERYMIGWSPDIGGQSGTDGIDYIDINNKYTSYKAKIRGGLYKVGTFNNKKTYGTVEFDLGAPLASGQGVKILHRSNIDGSLTTIGTWDFATLGAIQNYSDNGNVVDVTDVQLEVELTSAGATSPKLREVRLIPA